MHVAAGLDEDCLSVLASMSARPQRVYCGRGGAWDVALEAYGPAEQLQGSGGALGRARRWVSLTPYLHPWHAKPGFGAAEQLRREIGRRGLPAPAAITRLPAIEPAGRRLRPVDFHRIRDKRGLVQPDTRGSLWLLDFPEPVAGPLAFGFGCHFGLGLFVPCS